MITGPLVVSSFTQYSGGHLSGREPLVVSADGIAGSCILSLPSQPIIRLTMATRDTHFETRDTFVPPPTRPMNQARHQDETAKSARRRGDRSLAASRRPRSFIEFPNRAR